MKPWCMRHMGVELVCGFILFLYNREYMWHILCWIDTSVISVNNPNFKPEEKNPYYFVVLLYLNYLGWKLESLSCLVFFTNCHNLILLFGNETLGTCNAHRVSQEKKQTKNKVNKGNPNFIFMKCPLFVSISKSRHFISKMPSQDPKIYCKPSSNNTKNFLRGLLVTKLYVFFRLW
jgi:hypothetical protein